MATPITYKEAVKRFDRVKRLPSETIAECFTRVILDVDEGTARAIWAEALRRAPAGVPVGQWMDEFETKAALVRVLQKPPR